MANIVEDEKPKEVVKKPKKMVEADIFDFSDIKPVQKLALPENSEKKVEEEPKKITASSSNLQLHNELPNELKETTHLK